MQISQYEQDYHKYHLDLLRSMTQQIAQQLPFVSEDCSADDREFIEQLHALCEQPQSTDFLAKGQDLLCKIVSAYSHLMPLVYRDLLWFFGGDCLHFMPDEEIAVFQALDEQREEAIALNQAFSYKDARAKTLGLH
jgi:hypothetical protein